MSIPSCSFSASSYRPKLTRSEACYWPTPLHAKLFFEIDSLKKKLEIGNLEHEYLLASLVEAEARVDPKSAIETACKISNIVFRIEGLANIGKLFAKEDPRLVQKLFKRIDPGRFFLYYKLIEEGWVKVCDYVGKANPLKALSLVESIFGFKGKWPLQVKLLSQIGILEPDSALERLEKFKNKGEAILQKGVILARKKKITEAFTTIVPLGDFQTGGRKILKAVAETDPDSLIELVRPMYRAIGIQGEALVRVLKGHLLSCSIEKKMSQSCAPKFIAAAAKKQRALEIMSYIQSPPWFAVALMTFSAHYFNTYLSIEELKERGVFERSPEMEVQFLRGGEANPYWRGTLGTLWDRISRRCLNPNSQLPCGVDLDVMNLSYKAAVTLAPKDPDHALKITMLIKDHNRQAKAFSKIAGAFIGLNNATQAIDVAKLIQERCLREEIQIRLVKIAAEKNSKLTQQIIDLLDSSIQTNARIEALKVEAERLPLPISTWKSILSKEKSEEPPPKRMKGSSKS